MEPITIDEHLPLSEMRAQVAKAYRGKAGALPFLQATALGLAGTDEKGDWRLIALTQGRFATVDAADYAELNQHLWYARWNSCTGTFYALRNVPTKTLPGKQSTAYMAIAIMGPVHGRVVDHEDHDTLNNRRFNLRHVTHSQNCHHRQLRPSSATSSYVGVSWHKKSKRWVAQISHKGKVIHIGLFTEEVRAAEAYRNTEKRLIGNSFVINRIDQPKGHNHGAQSS